VAEVEWRGSRVRATEGELMVRFHRRVPEAARRAVLAGTGWPDAPDRELDAVLVSLPAGMDAGRAAGVLSALPRSGPLNRTSSRGLGLSLASDSCYQGSLTPQQWGLEMIQVDRAWNDPDCVGSKGDPSQVIGIVDSGVDYTHEDFFTPPGERAS